MSPIETITDPAAFAITANVLRAARAAPPDARSHAGRELAAIMRRVFSLPGKTRGDIRRVASWNVDHPHRAAAIGRAMRGMADAFLLQEIGLPCVRELTELLGLHAVWAPEYIDIGPEHRRRGETFTGNAILSREPLEVLSLIRFQDQADWYHDEKRLPALGERGKRWAAKKLGYRVRTHEIRLPPPYGGRMALAARSGGIAFVNTHLENKAPPELRQRQMREVIDFVKQAEGPTVFGGDLNTSGRDAGFLNVSRLMTLDESGLFKDVLDSLGVRPANQDDSPTFRGPPIMDLRLDWLFLHDPAKGHRAASAGTVERSESDHNPVVLEIKKDPGR